MGTNFFQKRKFRIMPKKYAREPAVKKQAVKARGQDLAVSFKNTYNTARAVKGMKVQYAVKYLNACLNKQRCIPQRRYCGSTGRTAQAKEFGVTKGRWPTKSIKIVLGLLENMLANANFKQMQPEDLVVSHVQVNRAPCGRRRTYRAHGRITPFMSHPCHVEMWACLKSEGVAKNKNAAEHRAIGASKVALARNRVQSRLREGESK